MPTPRATERLDAGLRQLDSAGLYRRRRTVVRDPGLRPAELIVDGRRCVAFCSNDYLGLAQDPRIAQAMAEGALRWGTGSGAAHLVAGHTTEHHALEEELAEFTGFSRALLFSTGYMANLGLVCALAGRGDLIVEDRLNHASLIDASRLSGATVRRYSHGDPGAAARRLEAPARRKFIVSDGVFSMDGDVAPLAALERCARQAGAELLVDDAHGIGVLGPGGRGSLPAAGLSPAASGALVGTLGKAFGTFGAFVAGSEALVETLIQQARSYIYTTAPPPALASATRIALQILREEEWRRQHLSRLIRRFRVGAATLGLRLMPSDTPIQPVLVGDAVAAVAAAEVLFRSGIWVSPIRPPTVPAGGSRLRVTFSATHEESDVDRLLAGLAEIPVLHQVPAG